MQTLVLIAALASAAALGAGVVLWLTSRKRAVPLPREWNLMLRPVFTADERRMHRQLREAFPQYIVLAKLPLTRFTQPTEPARVVYWHSLISALHVTFALCTPNGRVLTAIDIEGRHLPSRRATAIKTGVLQACRVQYLRFYADQLPSLAEVQLAVEGHARAVAAAAPPPQEAPTRLAQASQTLSTTVQRRREQRAGWQESAYPDSFFAPDSRLDGLIESGFAPLNTQAPAPAPRDADIAAVVVDTPSADARRPA
ncbi:DUF2726 domain-containing protein [Caldimonas thermodepolymerans]|uniref:DUF2726 domain-containing protein n=1 Tax=Caldimonas thermodepolymerans TaxID=215580 RepID=A0A2S5T654_9BURK|nr:DUF2726 domain-containing protein [Caldimonas thermodepolymerans]PPE70483.1 hypothetical protein C1702_07420 [Caldimonas thermodepolymerans]QPC31150.1 DUF2726 domain-containing protein [Caldimonas thermodepolymerans]RDH96607.1 uncharacterized protein DUF2726 [Caldimonas thermodepolymerans]